MKRTLTLDVEPSAFFDVVARIGADEAALMIGLRVVGALLGGLGWQDRLALNAVYGIDAAETKQVTQQEPGHGG